MTRTRLGEHEHTNRKYELVRKKKNKELRFTNGKEIQGF